MNHSPKSKKPAQCEHIKTNGVRCGSPALRTRRFCYFHHRAHDLRHLLRRRPEAHLQLPLLEDANAIQMAIQQVAEAVLEERIDNKRAGLLLFAFQTAACNLKNCDFEPKQLREHVSPAIQPIIELLMREMELELVPKEGKEDEASPAEAPKKPPAPEKETPRTASSSA